MGKAGVEVGKEYFFIILGTTLLALAINMFYNPNQMVVGGVTGLGVIIESYSRQYFPFVVTLSATNILLNIPLFLLSYFMLGKGVLGRTVFATFYLSAALIYTGIFPKFTGDLLLAAVYGGAISGVGIGLVFRGLATTGGVDLVASMIHKKYNHLSVSKIIFWIDFFIIALGLFVFGVEKAMYAIIAVYISSRCMNAILEGMSFSKAAFIISDKSEAIADGLMKEIERGVTGLHGIGMYTKAEKTILLCVFSQKEITKVKKLVIEIDDKAFIIVTDSKEVLGEGFQNIG